ncbi:hypothetical protein D3C79_886620 [compost metagenome]
MYRPPDLGIAAAISATLRAEARVMIPPIPQARILIQGVPALFSTIPGFRKIPDPIIIPTTMAKASKNVTDFFNGFVVFIVKFIVLSSRHYCVFPTDDITMKPWI